MKTYFTYITTNRKNGVLYTGMTNNLIIRTSQHKEKIFKGFSSKYNADRLVWFEEFQWVHDAIIREKEIKGWKREKRLNSSNLSTRTGMIYIPNYLESNTA
ncbi:GIY-YIG nuclease family protein [Gracilimonas sp.]|uniref:GIY-YIG nuclease family protein n=1 Tax=Gracilimonas sp. TaxID=1974203 RepID=UPI003BAAE362